MSLVKVKNFLVGTGQPLTIICGPCVIESEAHAMETAEFLTLLMQELGLQFIYKSSYDKANRSSYQSFR
ncbi:MAG: 3-deoxy-8-phosphooctulonate synthase, partial [Rhabdochlamydiaceae bacterium]